MLSFSRSVRVLLISCLFVASFCLSPVHAADPFEDQVLPFLKTYCVQCHNKKTASGELDLTRYSSASKVLEDFRQWEHVVTFLKKEEMPPAKAKQPSAALRAEILTTLEQVLVKEARKLAGDPGVVPPRRLTNAEFDNTIHDLTGVDIRPAAAFPLDPASGEGFNNTGEALTMSPSLFKKYYGAGQLVAEHALLTSQGLKFAPHPVVTFADRQKFYEQQILRFYEDHKVEYETYLAALWKHKHLGALRHVIGLEDLAKEHRLSLRYLQTLSDALNGEATDEFYLGWLRQRWQAIPGPKNDKESAPTGEALSAIKALASDIRLLSQRLCPPETQAIVANAGNGPVDHLERRRRMASTRDAFDVNALTRQRISYEYTNVAGRGSLKLVIHFSGSLATKADGYVVLTGGFATGNPENAKFADAKKKNWTLRAILAEYAPEQLKKLEFGVHPQRKAIDPDALVLKAPALVDIDIPAEAFKIKGNLHFFADCKLEGSTRGSVQFKLLDRLPTRDDLNRPVLTLFEADHADALKIRTSGEAFCRLFPNRFYFVDGTRGVSAGFHLIEGFFRDDQPLRKLVLSAAENQELDRLWNELNFVTDIWHKMLRGFVFFERSERNFLKHPDFDSIKEEDPELIKDEPLVRFKELYLKRSGVKATGDELTKHPISIFFEDIRSGLKYRTETLQKMEPTYLKDLEDFARRAYRRPLTEPELLKMRKFFHGISQDKDHGIEQAVQASIIRILVSPYFTYHFVAGAAGDTVAPLPDFALASRLSYFIWGSMPDEELFAVAKSGKLRDVDVLRAQTRRMLKDPKVSRFALEFFGQWFGHREFLKQEAVNRQAFPTFDDALRLAMFEEPTRLATHLIQQNLPITDLLSSDKTFVTKKLAQHYGMPFPGNGGEWEMIDGLQKQGRGGVMGMAVFLTKNSQPQRTSPVKRGFWVVHRLLGEHIPAPPADVAVLPAKETDTNGKTIRQLLALHTDDNKCARCHVRFDPVGLSMEGFDPIGRTRTKDLAGRPVDNVVHLPSGKEARGVPEFAKHLVMSRKGEFNKTLSQKFLGYALGRSLQLSDHDLLDAMQASLKANDDRLPALFETVITSPQFLNQRCRDFSVSAFTKGK